MILIKLNKVYNEIKSCNKMITTQNSNDEIYQLK